MMPNRDDGPAAGDQPGPTMHLSCVCQRDADEPFSLCGFLIATDRVERDIDVDTLIPDDDDLPSSALVFCVVCHDLARAALVSGMCERCVR